MPPPGVAGANVLAVVASVSGDFVVGRPWEGDDHIAADDARGWETLSPSATAFGAHLPKVPRAMTVEDIARVRAQELASRKLVFEGAGKLSLDRRIGA